MVRGVGVLDGASPVGASEAWGGGVVLASGAAVAEGLVVAEAGPALWRRGARLAGGVGAVGGVEGPLLVALAASEAWVVGSGAAADDLCGDEAADSVFVGCPSLSRPMPSSWLSFRSGCSCRALSGIATPAFSRCGKMLERASSAILGAGMGAPVAASSASMACPSSLLDAWLASHAAKSPVRKCFVCIRRQASLNSCMYSNWPSVSLSSSLSMASFIISACLTSLSSRIFSISSSVISFLAQRFSVSSAQALVSAGRRTLIFPCAN